MQIKGTENMKAIYLICPAAMLFLTVLFNGCSKGSDACSTSFPLKVGNTWVFVSNYAPFELDTFIAVKDTIVNGSNYMLIVHTGAVHSFGNDPTLVRNSSGDIWAITNSYYDHFGTISHYGEQILLKENAAVGESWSTGTDYSRTIIEKGTMITVAGHTYTDVTRVRETQISSSGNTWDFYYSKCVGIVKSNNYDLKSYTVN